MSCPVCQCTFSDSNCVHFFGQGTIDEPYIPELVVDPAGIATCSPSGLGVFLPPPLNNPPAVFLGIAIPQTVPGNVTQIVLFTNALYDTDRMFSTENPSRITFNAPGLYQVEAYATVANGAAPPQAVFIRENATDILGRWELESVGGPFIIQNEFDAGDYVETLITNNSPNDFVIPGPSQQVGRDLYALHFTAQFIRPL